MLGALSAADAAGRAREGGAADLLPPPPASRGSMPSAALTYRSSACTALPKPRRPLASPIRPETRPLCAAMSSSALRNTDKLRQLRAQLRFSSFAGFCALAASLSSAPMQETVMLRGNKCRSPNAYPLHYSYALQHSHRHSTTLRMKTSANDIALCMELGTLR